jgi:hypothetical protein
VEKTLKFGLNEYTAYKIDYFCVYVTVLHFYLRRDLGSSAITGIIRFVSSWY